LCCSKKIFTIKKKLMKIKNFTNFPLWKNFVKTITKIIKFITKLSTAFNSAYPNTSQNIQLTFIYFFAIIDLLYGILSNVFSLGYFPEILAPLFPLIKSILLSPIFRIWASPEKVFFLSYVAIEFMIVRSTFNLSKLVKYNILLIFALLMLQGLAISYWDLLFHREVATSAARWLFDEGILIASDKNLAISFFLNTFIIFILLYFYLYIKAISGKFSTLPGMEWLTDSIAFWLRIKTPTMRFGNRKKKDDNK